MLNLTLQFIDLQGLIDPHNLQSAEQQSSPQIAHNTHPSPGPGHPFAAYLHPGSSWYSPGNAFRLTLQATDGNLVVECIDDLEGAASTVPQVGGGGPFAPTQAQWVPVWSARTNGKGVTEVDFQIDGNLVAYAGAHAVFSTGTSGNENSVLRMQDDGNLVIYKEGNIAIFSTNTSVLNSPGKNT